MRYSEAIRLGGMMRPKSRGKFYDLETGGVCVQGAALDAIGELDKRSICGTINHDSMKKYFPFVETTIIDRRDFPDLTIWFGPAETISQVAVALNNRSNWTREQIADWVERMEEKYGDPQIIKEEPCSTNAASAMEPLPKSTTMTGSACGAKQP